MTRKDFELIAATIKHLDLDFYTAKSGMLRKEIADDFARALKGTNGAFDAVRFIRAATED